MNGQLQYNRGLTEPRLPRSALAVRVTAVMLLCSVSYTHLTLPTTPYV